MVSKVNMERENSVETLKKVLESRKRYKDFFNSISEDITKSYEMYHELKGDPARINALDLKKYTKDDKKRKTTLINLYSPKEHEFLYSILAGMRRKHKLIMCPSCGNMGAPGTLDHYLPKDHFPEHSINLNNLTPMCQDCQNKKGDEYKCDDDGRMFIHPYYFGFDRAVICLKIKKPYDAPVFYLYLDKDVVGANLALLESHLEGIGFVERYVEYCTAMYSWLIGFASECREEGGDLKGALEHALIMSDSQKSVNCWESIFYRAAIGDDELMDFLLEGELPDNP